MDSIDGIAVPVLANRGSVVGIRADRENIDRAQPLNHPLGVRKITRVELFFPDGLGFERSN